MAVGKWINLTHGDCSAPSEGRAGEAPYVICVRSDPQFDGYNITFRVIFRELYETPSKGNKIILKKLVDTFPTTSVSEEIKFRKGDTYSKLTDNKVLIITEIKISLV
jgi:hypothetical protein